MSGEHTPHRDAHAGKHTNGASNPRGVAITLLAVSVVVHLVVLWVIPTPLRTVLTPQQDILISLKEPPPPPPPEPEPEPPPKPEQTPEPEPVPESEPPVEASPPDPGPVIGVEGDGAGAIHSGDTVPAFPEPEPEPAIEPPPPQPPPPEPEPEPEPEADVQAILREWQLGIKAAIESRKRYPAIAERLGHSGNVKFGFTVDADGGLLDVSVKASSGWEELDEAALDAVRAAAPFAPIPAEIPRDELTLSMTLRFRLD